MVINKQRYSFEQLKIAKHLLYWTALIVPVSLITGSLVALFLWLLELVTQLRWNNLWLIFLLPLIGLPITALYRYGKNAAAGNDLIIDEIHKPGGGIPARMTPLVLVSTVVTHLFGGSAGREGTAIQMGGSMSSLLSKCYKLKHNDKRILLMCGMSAGFGAVFGTPIAGAVFAMEVLSIGRIKYDALIPCLIASILADITCSAYGIEHTYYQIAFAEAGANGWASFFSFDLLLLVKVILAGVVFGLVGYLFAETSHTIKATTTKYISNPWLIPILGGVVIVGISYALGTFDYLGLGVTNPTGGVSIVSAFNVNGADTWSWFWKLLLTAITLSTGFKGGEVTPLFFIGATLGNTLAMFTGAPVDLFAGLGFIAVFAGATNTPLACMIMGVELFGSHNILYYAVACFTAYYFSGHSGIYGSQRLAVSKFHLTASEEYSIKEIKNKKKIK